MVAAATAQVSAAGSEVDALRRLLRLKGREVQQLRHLAQEVLLQRSEVEIFLLSSLHQVRTCGLVCESVIEEVGEHQTPSMTGLSACLGAICFTLLNPGACVAVQSRYGLPLSRREGINTQAFVRSSTGSRQGLPLQRGWAHQQPAPAQPLQQAKLGAFK